MELTAKGQNGTVTFDGQIVTITRKGFLAATTQGRGEKRIPIQSISAIQLKTAGLGQGFISFTIAGAAEKQSRMGRQSRDAFADENSVVFLRKSNQAMTEIRDAIEAAVNAPTGGATTTSADEIGKYGELHRQGLITDEEFAAAKAKLLGL